MSDTFIRVKKVISVLLDWQGESDDEIEPESILSDIGLDSLDLVELVMEIEKEFGLEIPDEEAEEAKTVQDIVDYIEKQK